MQLKAIPIFLILIVGLIAVFGSLGINSIDHFNGHLCPISMVGNECPPSGNSFTFAKHHLSGLQYLTQSIVSLGSPALMFSIFLLVALLTIFGNVTHKISLQQSFLFRIYRLSKEIQFKAGGQLLHWLALHNKRDSHIVY